MMMIGIEVRLLPCSSVAVQSVNSPSLYKQYVPAASDVSATIEWTRNTCPQTALLLPWYDVEWKSIERERERKIVVHKYDFLSQVLCCRCKSSGNCFWCWGMARFFYEKIIYIIHNWYKNPIAVCWRANVMTIILICWTYVGDHLVIAAILWTAYDNCLITVSKRRRYVIFY